MAGQTPTTIRHPHLSMQAFHELLLHLRSAAFQLAQSMVRKASKSALEPYKGGDWENVG